MNQATSEISIDHWLKNSAGKLAATSASARVDAEYILSEVLNKGRSYFFTWPDYLLTFEELTAANKMLTRRLRGEPVAHIVGEREFWSLSLFCNASTLIPREDTEVLVEVALQLPINKHAFVLDLGTGTGALALAIASERPDYTIHAVDRCAAAVALAERNRQRHTLYNVRCFQSDWFSSIDKKYHLIVSNPPYIDINDRHLNEGDLRFEPHSALVAGEDGLADIEKIVRAAPEYLHPQGHLVVEHGWQQKQKVQDIFCEHGFLDIVCRQDYGGNDRLTIARRP